MKFKVGDRVAVIHSSRLDNEHKIIYLLSDRLVELQDGGFYVLEDIEHVDVFNSPLYKALNED